MDQIRQNLRSDKSWFDWWYVFKNIIARLAKKCTKHYFTGTDTIPHDRGIIRAINSTYQPNERVEGDPRHTIFVGKLHIKTDEVNSFPTFCSYSGQFWQPTKTDVIWIHSKKRHNYKILSPFRTHWNTNSVNVAESLGAESFVIL